MGLRGPKPKPDSKSSAKAPNAPKADNAAPARPENMDERVSRYWDETVAQLRKLNVLDSADGGAILRYAVSRTVMDELIDLKAHPACDQKDWLGRWKTICEITSKLEACFGFTAADRTRVNMKGSKLNAGAGEEKETTEAALLKLVNSQSA